MQGSAYYVSQLPQEERERIVGDVQIDMVGHYQSKEIMLKTTDGQPTLVGNLINQQAAALLGAPLRTETEAASDHMSFVRGQIPAVLVEQDNLGVENHRFSDQPSIIVPDKVVPLAQVLKAMLEQVMSSDSGSFAAEARTVTQVAEAGLYTFTDETILFMGKESPSQITASAAAGPS